MATKPVQEFQFKDIKKTTNRQKFLNAIYDSDKKEFLGRTKENWYKLLIFYAIFYACLAALVATCMQGLLATLSDKEPKYKLGDSLIGTNPGLGFRPISKKTEQGSLIWYNLNDPETTKQWITLIDEFLEPYNVDQNGKNYQECSEKIPASLGKVCTVKVEDFGPCVKSNNYMYNTSSPCVFLKLNKIFDWVPQYQRTPQNEMPQDLQELVTLSGGNSSTVWISCQGEKPSDVEMIKDFEYFPTRGFPGYYFPYRNVENYLSPVVAVRVLGVSPNSVVNVECRAWAGNIHYSTSRNNREGSVKFEILVDSKH